jgi:hypothetical protein
MQIDLIGMSQMIGYPTQFPSVSMMDWRTNQPNARYWVLKLIKDSFHSGDQLVDTTIGSGDVAAQGFLTPRGRKLLLANKRNHSVEIEIPNADHAAARTVDEQTGDTPARLSKLADGKITLEPFAVTVVSW